VKELFSETYRKRFIVAILINVGQ
jgi:MFS transporter, SP family, major inositol transporter